jgi:glycine cleavage system H protein
VLKVPDDLKYTKTHEWILVKEGIGKVGFTDYAQDAMGDIVHVELPPVGVRFEQGQAIAEVESVKAAADVLAPVTGEVTETHSAVANDPHLVNTDPYGEGWLFKLKLAAPDELATLLDPVMYRELIKKETE